MRSREFMKTGVFGATAACIPPHNFDQFDFGPDPAVQDRLDQGPFPADVCPLWTVVMALLVDKTIRQGDWLRTDTIFIENEQIEAISNRPPWTGAAIEVGISDGSLQSLRIDGGVTYSDKVISHVRDVGASYFSAWNWHRISAAGLQRYYQAYPHALDALARSIGYRVRPSWVWTYKERGESGLIGGFVNDGISGVPGVLRVSLIPNRRGIEFGLPGCGLSAAGPLRQALLPLPRGTCCQGLKLKAEIVVKNQSRLVRWACWKQLNPDGSLTLRATNDAGMSDGMGGLCA